MFVQRNRSRGVRASVAALALGVGFFGFIPKAEAHRFSVSFWLRGSPVWMPPVYETRARTIVEPAVYEGRPKRIWHEPVYEERQLRVEIPVEVRTVRVPRYDRHGRIVGYRLEEELIRPARYIYKTDRVLVRKGYYETVVEKVCVRPERARTVYEEVLVEPGHWVHPRYTLGPGGRVRVQGSR